MGNTKTYNIQYLSNDQLPDVQKIILQSFKKKIPLQTLRNKYNIKHLITKNIATIAYNHNKPIAFYGAIPQKFGNNQSEYLVAHACDSFTIPEYQKQGLHYQLALKAYERMREIDIKMVYAFHSENTYYSTKKLAWREGQRMIRFHVKIGNLPKSRICNKLGFNSITNNNTKKTLTPLCVSNHTIQSPKSEQINQLYDSSFFTYKENFNKHYLIQVCDCIFYLKVDVIMHIGFFEYNNVTNFEKAIEQLKQLAKKIGIDEILFQIDGNSERIKLLTQFATPKPSWLIGYLPFDEKFIVEKFIFNYADLDTF